VYVTTERPKEDDGWREGRPVEDPEKTKRWGFVTAKPSEFLVHVRGGQVRSRSSGQGATCFKWPQDAVSVIPTSLQKLAFTADQITVEKVGVEITGLAVYRIAEPLVAYRVLNFSFPERAQEKLEDALTAMLVGATRRLVANLSVDDCLQKRKRALADELLAEVAPVLGGHGRPDDHTDQGWGLVLDTIEIQEVRVLSERVFSAMQAPYRALLDKRADEARTEADKERELRAAEHKRAVEEARIQAELKVREQRRALAEREAATKREATLRDVAIARELEAARADAASEQKRAALARAAAEAAAEVEAHNARAQAVAAALALAETELALQAQQREQEIALAERAGLAQANVDARRADVDRVRAEAKARLVTAEKLPELAAAVGERVGEMKVVQVGGEAVAPIASAVERLLRFAGES
jgi:regulator of protease activity HflC (stomatin/prohibitin superfamily)